jgi:hypothetical protein
VLHSHGFIRQVRKLHAFRYAEQHAHTRNIFSLQKFAFYLLDSASIQVLFFYTLEKWPMYLFMLSIFLVVAGAQSEPAVPSGIVKGSVKRAVTGEPIANVQITMTQADDGSTAVQEILAALEPGAQMSPTVADMVRTAARDPAVRESPLVPDVATSANRPSLFTANTDADGHFELKNVPPGKYTISAQRDGYVGPSVLGMAGGANVTTTPFRVTDGLTNSEIGLTLVPGGTISGQLRGPDGQPFIAMNVTAYQFNYQEDGRASLRLVVNRSTDDKGAFRLFWLAPGDYLLAVQPRVRMPNTPPTTPEDAYARTYYPGTTDPTAARLITVREGEDVTGVDVALWPSGFVRISGRSIDLAPVPSLLPSVGAGGASPIILVPHDPRQFVHESAPVFRNIASDRSKGQFEIDNVPPGEYDLISVSDRRGRNFPGRITVNVGYQNLTDVNVTIPAGVEVKARLTYVGGPKPANADSVRLLLRSRETYPYPYDTAVLPGAGIAARTNAPSIDATGLYVFPSVPEARYTFQVTGLARTAYLEDIRLNGVSIFDSGLVISSVALTEPVEVIVNVGGRNLEGSVLDSRLKSVANALVVLVPQQSRRSNTAIFRTALTNEAGRFSLNAVPSGEYKVFAWGTVPPNFAWHNAEFLARYEDMGEAVTVTPEGVMSLQLAVIP